MASNLALDDDLIKEAQRIGGVKTKKRHNFTELIHDGRFVIIGPIRP